jgi:hypothetical protein
VRAIGGQCRNAIVGAWLAPVIPVIHCFSFISSGPPFLPFWSFASTRFGQHFALSENLRLRLAGGFATRSISGRRIAAKLGPAPVWCKVNRGVYPWSPSHDQCGMLRPFGTSSAEW